eukprot:358768-Chlamydomonas_euryale.AAC.1
MDGWIKKQGWHGRAQEMTEMRAQGSWVATCSLPFSASACRFPIPSPHCPDLHALLQQGQKQAEVHEEEAEQTTHTVVSVALAFPDAITSISSSAKSQSLQRAPLTRPGPGSIGHPSYRVAH